MLLSVNSEGMDVHSAFLDQLKPNDYWGEQNSHNRLR